MLVAVRPLRRRPIRGRTGTPVLGAVRRPVGLRRWVVARVRRLRRLRVGSVARRRRHRRRRGGLLVWSCGGGSGGGGGCGGGGGGSGGGSGVVGVAGDVAADVAMPHLLAPSLYEIVGRPDLSGRAVHDAVKVLSGAGNINAALGLIHRVRGQEGAEAAALRVAEAELFRWRGDKRDAVACLAHVVRGLQAEGTQADAPLLASALCRLGKWVGEDKSETRTNVIAEYLTPAARLVATRDCKERAVVFFTLGRFVDRMFTTLSTRVSSSAGKPVEAAQKKYDEVHDFLRKNRGTLGTMHERIMKYTSNHLGAISSKAEQDEERLALDQNAYLLQSVKAYSICTLYSNEYDLVSVFRLVALWLQNPANAELNHYLTGFFGRSAASHKFVPLAYQLVSRLTTPETAEDSAGAHDKGVADPFFQSTLSVLVDRVAREHPSHVLYHLSALAHGAFLPEGNHFKEVFIADEQKIACAKGLLKTLARSKALNPVITELSQLVGGYLEFAFYKLDKKSVLDGQRMPVPEGLKIRSLSNLRHTVVTTIDLDASPTGDYSTAPTIKDFDVQFTTAGGVNLPKIIKCLGSDGKWYKQLVKGGMDDLRQDAVLEQIFCLCNSLLRDNAATRDRRLAMRTYKVVSLSPTSGVVQWVNDTIPMGEWLLGRTGSVGAHQRYRPNDMTPREARIALGRKGLSDSEKRVAFKGIVERYTPVFHHFFAERYKKVGDWVARRGAYTRSTAVASMVGYVVGLGDRHAQNILVDTTTGEVVHIDLGIAFEKGKFLPCPELVPFRLTRDVVDGMGVTGVEGAFRRSAEASLTVLRRNKQLLRTVVDVFVHDPLYNYSLDASRLMHKQEGFAGDAKAKKKAAAAAAAAAAARTASGSEGNPDAELAIMRVSEKLDGYEDGETLSAEGHVNTLIRAASSLDTLALMYVGWSPWM
eukprot:Rhum_TRINITY_DN14378_c9_g1::Rhum_TRINITY_DN14378_c9_g1_i1::g.84380::m.84380/K04728/ATM, TEL1; ataxia telangiectasia mutated family protein